MVPSGSIPTWLLGNNTDSSTTLRPSDKQKYNSRALHVAAHACSLTDVFHVEVTEMVPIAGLSQPTLDREPVGGVTDILEGNHSLTTNVNSELS